MTKFEICICLLLLVFQAAGHSQMAEPQSISPRVCRRGGDPNPTNCHGPCDLRAIVGRYANFASPDNPAAVYRRGEKITIKYQRNNHGPGGFVRITLVPPHKMMDKEVHERNAFHYSCFGATPMKASPHELGADKWGFSIVGNDGKDVAPGYYELKAMIPAVVPDGKYVLGWVWYGGTGGPVSNDQYTQEPSSKGYFSDYWSCSFIEIKGGEPLQSAYMPVFDNDMEKFSRDGCMSANDAPEVCQYEPCLTKASYQKPKPFIAGSTLAPLTQFHFYSSSPENRSSPNVRNGPMAKSSGLQKEKRISLLLKKRSCHCIAGGERCNTAMAKATGGFCKRNTKANDQPDICKNACCEYCRLANSLSSSVCKKDNVRTACRF